MSEAALVATAPATLAGVATRLLGDIDGLVEHMGEAYVREIPEYAAMPPEQLRTEVLPVSRYAVTTYFQLLIADRPVGPDELETFESSGHMRLRMGVPLDSVLHAYRVAARVTWQAIVRVIEPGEEALLGELAARWMDFIDHTSGAVARGYLSESHKRLRSVDARRRELVEALLSATDPAEVAAVSLRFSTVLASSYVPVVVAGSDAAVQIDALLAAAPTGTLGGHRGQRVLLLVPSRFDDVAPLRRVASHALFAWGRAGAPGAALLDEVRHVEQLLETACAEGHSSGAFGPDDLLVEQLLLGNDRVADALRRRVHERIVARDPGGVITSTLRVFLGCGSVPETARRECVHPNTVGYRLQRVRDLTDLDPRVPADAAVLVLGLGLPR